MSGGVQPTAREAGGGGYLVRNGAQLVLTGTFIRPPRTPVNPPLYSEWGLLFFLLLLSPTTSKIGSLFRFAVYMQFELYTAVAA
jgi:hypothetical protein